MPAQEIYSEWAKTLAEQLVASGDAPPAGLSDDERLALAWALKRRVDTAWSSDPTLVTRAALALVGLSAPRDNKSRTPTLTEICAVSFWGDGIAALASGRMSEAVGCLDDAAACFRLLRDRNNAAQTQVPKIMALAVMGLHEQAAECGHETQREFLALDDLHAASKVSLNLGNLFAHREAHESALMHYREASKLFSSVRDH